MNLHFNNIMIITSDFSNHNSKAPTTHYVDVNDNKKINSYVNVNNHFYYRLSNMQVIVYLMNLLKKHLSRSTLEGKLIEVGDMCVCVCLCVWDCVHIRMCVCICMCLSVCLPACLPAYLPVYLSVFHFLLSVFIYLLFPCLVTFLTSHSSTLHLSVYFLFSIFIFYFVVALFNIRH